MKAASLVLLTSALGLLFLEAGSAPVARAQPEPVRLKQFIYVIRLVPRLFEQKAWTAQDQEAARRHFERLKAAGEHGPVILAGRTEDTAEKTFGIVVFEAPDTAAAKAFMENDPAVKAGIMTGELHPYLMAVQRTPSAR